MDFGSLRTLARDINFSVHGVPATVELTTGGRIATRVIWLTTETEDAPIVQDHGGQWAPDTLQRRDPIRALAVSRAEVPTLPRGSVILAPERGGGVVLRWIVDGHQRTEADQHRVIVLRDPNDEDDAG